MGAGRGSNFLLLSERSQWQLFEMRDEALWPLHPVALPAVAPLLAAALSGWRRAGPATGLGLAWTGVATLFLDARQEPTRRAVTGIKRRARAAAS